MIEKNILVISVSEKIDVRDLFISARTALKRVIRVFKKKLETLFIENVYIIRGALFTRGPNGLFIIN